MVLEEVSSYELVLIISGKGVSVVISELVLGFTRIEVDSLRSELDVISSRAVSARSVVTVRSVSEEESFEVTLAAPSEVVIEFSELALVVPSEMTLVEVSETIVGPSEVMIVGSFEVMIVDVSETIVDVSETVVGPSEVMLGGSFEVMIVDVSETIVDVSETVVGPSEVMLVDVSE